MPSADTTSAQSISSSKPVSRHVLYAKVKALLELDRSFAQLRSEAEKLHEQQLDAARAAEIRQREELAFTRRRERLTNIFAEASIDLASLEKAIVTELSQLFEADCVLRLSSPVTDGMTRSRTRHRAVLQKPWKPGWSSGWPIKASGRRRIGKSWSRN